MPSLIGGRIGGFLRLELGRASLSLWNGVGLSGCERGSGRKIGRGLVVGNVRVGGMVCRGLRAKVKVMEVMTLKEESRNEKRGNGKCSILDERGWVLGLPMLESVEGMGAVRWR